ncbi:hypothetical protein NKR19_g2462 [Coniochaeta hoffmannii]|uniref:Uncharacterized protein n=1 Tax=Coniochaeta hoffmannii TaxID=91930 RepID=A0AA38VN26_9PEZI|nr:hypothetical protein NKR19_g2462 [Coniochaeta hoffmannii]
MGIVMSSHRPILAPRSRKGKASKDKPPTARMLPQSAGVSHSKTKTARTRKKPAGVGMFGSWFDEPEGYDEVEDSKTWEQPWGLPPTPLSPVFSPPPFTPPRPPSRTGDSPDKLRVAAKETEQQPESSQAQDVSRRTGKQARKSKAKNGPRNTTTPTKTPVQPLTPSPSISKAFKTSPALTEKAQAKSIPQSQTNLFSLPLEVRDKIYGHLLTAATKIPVMRGWTQCYVRYRGGLEPAILSVCRQTYQEGIRVLYMTNTFMYLIRDGGDPIPEALSPSGFASPMALPLDPPPLSELRNGTKGRAPKRQKRAKAAAKRSTVGDVNRIIYLAKYAHLLRRVEIVLESNRDTKQYGLAMAKAIQLLGNGEGGVRANLTSLQLSLTPVEVEKPGGTAEWTVVKFFSSVRSNNTTTTQGSEPKNSKPPREEKHHPVTDALQDLQVRLLHVTVYTPSSRRLDMTLDMTFRAAADNLDRMLAHDSVIARQRAETAAASAEAFDNLALLVERACAQTDQAVKEGWWTEYGPPQVAAVRSAMEGLDTIRDRMKKYRSPWYEKVRDEYAARPEHASCVRKVGRRLLLSGE